MVELSGGTIICLDFRNNITGSVVKVVYVIYSINNEYDISIITSVSKIKATCDVKTNIEQNINIVQKIVIDNVAKSDLRADLPGFLIL